MVCNKMTLLSSNRLCDYNLPTPITFICTLSFLPSILGLPYQLAAGKHYSTYPVKSNNQPISINPISDDEMKDTGKPNITSPSSIHPVKSNIQPISITPILGGEMTDSDTPNITSPSSISPVNPSTPDSTVDTSPAPDESKKRGGVRLIQSEVHTPQVTLYNVTTGSSRSFKWSSNDRLRDNAIVIPFSFFHSKALTPLEKDNWFLFDEEGKSVTPEEIKPVSDNSLAFFVLPVLYVLFSE